MAHDTDRREEFERRLLARVRAQLDFSDERYPQGYEVTDFVLIARVYCAPEDSEMEPWYGGPYPGWTQTGFTVGSSPSYLTDQQLVEESLAYLEWVQETHGEGGDDAGDGDQL